MKAAVITGPDQPPVYTDFADPTAGDGQRIVELVAAGIHNVVRSRASGRHYSSSNTWPLIPGLDAVARTDDGRLIYTATQSIPYGTMAQRIPVASAFAIPLPDGTDPLAVAAGCNPGLASWLPLRKQSDALADAGGLGAVLVLGVTGMAGQIAVAAALTMGATLVVGVGRNTEVLDQLTGTHGDRFRAVALTGSDADSDAIRDAFDGQPPTTVIDFLWGPVAERTFVALAPLAEGAAVAHIEVGAMAGADACVPGALLRSRQYTLSGSGLGSVDTAVLFEGIAEFIGHVADGTIHVPYRQFPLSQVARAWEHSGPQRAVVVPD
ncbi:zinc-binding alcohol dehydrogenase family protein [Gordonia sp. X0973]|uniref:zinc-binding alcohol dehydrogenase family protein n=1 Tax=Gordonia sp. X0973 TaxID=2742602 RepID=UPI000F53C21A|nr:zinc-binding alcohol dehydrogenase family protein [Gordonia sp. X0973]QKT07055.1 zinc-binding alcohol dehydrogenase family protein [Gordonia sp. X0973]